MGKKAHIYIFGDIVNLQINPDYAADNGIVSLTSVIESFNQQDGANAEEIVVHIHSRGGSVDEGFAIYDFLVASGKKVTTIIEGLCASIATVPALAGSVREMMPNATIHIHNPWGEPWSMTGFTADDYQKMADEIRVAEDKLIAFYNKATKVSKKNLTDLMSEETDLNAEEALELGFITKISEPVKAFATFIKSKNNTMEKNKLQLVISALKHILGDKKALCLTTADGKKLDVTTDGEKAEVGKEVFMDSVPAADGEYLMPDKSKISVKSGKIDKIVPAPDGETQDGVLKALLEKVEKLEKSLGTKTTEESASTKLLEEITAHLEKISSLPPGKSTERSTPETVPAGQGGANESRSAAAIKRAKDRMAAEKEAAEKKK